MSSFVRTVVTFRTDQFNTTEPREYFINPCCFGDDLCAWMISRLKDTGTECDDQPGQEDFGWYFNFSDGNSRYCLVCGFRPAEPDGVGTWVSWIERSSGFIAGLFGGRDRGIEVGGPGKIDKVLRSCPQITDIRWHYKKDFDRGDETGAEAPE